MEILSQYDPRWASVKIGKSQWTVAKKGCYITAACMGANAIGANPKKLTPGTLAHDAALFTDTGDAIGYKVAEALGLRFLGAENVENDKAILESIKNPLKFCLLRVNSAQHFVLAWSRPLVGNDFNCADPLRGKVVRAKATFHDIDGERYFIQK